MLTVTGIILANSIKTQQCLAIPASFYLLSWTKNPQQTHSTKVSCVEQPVPSISGSLASILIY